MEKKWSYNLSENKIERRWDTILVLFLCVVAFTVLYFVQDWHIGLLSIGIAGLAIAMFLDRFRYRVYGLAINTTDDTLIIQKANLFKRYKTDTVKLSDVTTKFHWEYRGRNNRGRYVLKILVNRKMLCKVAEGEFEWDKWSLEEVHDFIQKLRGINHDPVIEEGKAIWRTDVKEGILMAYFYMCWFLLGVAFGFYLLNIIIQENWPGIYWVIYIYCGVAVLWVLSRMKQFAPYSFTVDTDNNRLLIEGMNMFGQKKSDKVSFTGLDAEFIREYNSKGGINSEFTLTLMTGDTVLLKIKEGHWGWSDKKLRAIYDYIQNLKQQKP